MAAEISGDKVILTVLKDSRPCAGAEIRLSRSGDSEKVLGVTAADGRLVHALGSGAKGAMLFAVEQYTEAAPASANYDRSEFAASAQLQL
jgi:hypothetical protein